MFKKRAAPSFSGPPPTPSAGPVTRGASSPTVSKEQRAELQQFLQLAYQSVLEYEQLRSQAPTQHLASLIDATIEEEKSHYQTLLHAYKQLSGKDPTITEPTLPRNDYIPALKAAFEKEQAAAYTFEQAARFTTNPALKEVYASLARDEQRHALWLLSFLTIYSTGGVSH
ncbi:ferritin-like domain-containing protein [Shouchella clausii]|uniref:ferritin-like domain-containing protein n=1 Tax=Shouchella clausii TaxID=79880 RepID=UPI000B97576E|nr:ferritin-like domain-containing protein [Shouchella clausii]AST94779.1 hypothetical protein BC8716_01725 [Shouchella clausii]MCR1289191.1 ferritin-like domain-containing protein [Shouchella clausii]MEB5474754.1 ferritin-like domain-containing protein [Shouchella clausii]PTL21942.1 hypothetical protein DA802_15385 [Shouchella clausii]QNM45219.1 ferritin-like domain-containing protein [Shouchella clausii]